MRTSKQKINPSLKNQIEKALAQVVADTNSLNEAESFLKGFLTQSEFEILAKRLAVGYWLTKKRSYANITRNLRVSTATTAETANNIKKEGFKKAIKRIEADEWANRWTEKIKKIF